MKTILTLMLLPFFGCASIVSSIRDGGPNKKRVEGGAASYYYLERSEGPFRPVPGATINPWVFGNIIYGGFPGFFVDGLTGAMFEPRVIDFRSDNPDLPK